MCSGTLFGYKVHFEDPTVIAGAKLALPVNSGPLRNIIHACNHIMSHILHFYHLVALDYVNPGLTRPFLCPRYDDQYYINYLRVYAVAPLIPAPTLNFLVTTFNGGVVPNLANPNDPGWAAIATGINGYLVGQYLKALDMRRICHEAGAIFSGKMPHAACYTPGGITGDVSQAKIDKCKELMLRVSAFIGSPFDFALGNVGTMMFDTVAAAYLFPEYFWMGNSYEHFMAFGWAEGGYTPGIRALVARPNALLPPGSLTHDGRLLRRGRKDSAAPPVGVDNVLNLDPYKIGECVAHSRYTGYDGYKHPWSGVTKPEPNGNETTNYSWLKSPRYEHDPGTWYAYEVGPLSRMVVNQHTIVGAGPLGTALQAYACQDPSLNPHPVLGNVSISGYYGGCLADAGYALAPVYGQPGPDLISVNPVNPPYNDGGNLQRLVNAFRIAYDNLDGVIGGGPITGGPDLKGVPYNGDSILDRIAARTLETRYMCDGLLDWLKGGGGGRITVGASGCTDRKIPYRPAKPWKKFKGYGMSEASRGALSHWIIIKEQKIIRYQCIVPTTWNANPRDVAGWCGPAEVSLQGKGQDAAGYTPQALWIANPSQPIEAIRTTHSYDFCIACAVHLITPDGDVVKADIPALPG